MSDAEPRRILRLTPLPCFEFVVWGTLRGSVAAARDSSLQELPSNAGEVRRDAAGRAEALHFAPCRWLVPAPTAALQARLLELDDAGVGSLADVDGKWQAFTLGGEQALPILESSINVERVLGEHACAAVMLFDCPAIVARAGASFEIWVAASYAEHFSSAVDAVVLRDSSAGAS